MAKVVGGALLALAVLGSLAAPGALAQTAMPSVSIMDASAAEGNALEFTVRLSAAAAGQVSLRYDTGAPTSGTAASAADHYSISNNGAITEGQDFVAVTRGGLMFAAGEQAKVITISVLGDQIDEPDETFTVELSEITGAAHGRVLATGTITDDDLPPIVWLGQSSGNNIARCDQASDIWPCESGARTHMRFRLRQRWPASAAQNLPSSGGAGRSVSGKAVLIQYETYIPSDAENPATPGTDYTAVRGTFTIPAYRDTDRPQSNRVYIDVPLIDDSDDEAHERVYLRLTGATNANVSEDTTGQFRPTHSGLILDDDDPPTVTAMDAAAAEGSPIPFIVSLSARSQYTVTMNYETVAPAASAAAPNPAAEYTDYTPFKPTQSIFYRLTFMPGETHRTVSVATAQDDIDEYNETLILRLSSAYQADGIGTALVLDQADAIGTIVNDDEGNQPTLTVADAAADEGDRLAFVFTLSGVSNRTVSVDYATGGTTSDTAVGGGADYVSAFGNLIIPPGATARTLFVQTLHDENNAETDETLTFTLSRLMDAVFTDADATTATATGTIRPVITRLPEGIFIRIEGTRYIREADAGETTTANYIISVSPAPTGTEQITVAYATSDGTATIADSDYQAASGTLTYSAGDTSRIITLTVIGDINPEDETESFWLSARPGTGPGTGTANFNVDAALVRAVTIIDNDTTSGNLPPVTVTGPSSVRENNNVQNQDIKFVVTVAETGFDLGRVEPVEYRIVPDADTPNGGTATPSASAPTPADADFLSASGLLTFTRARNVATVTVRVYEDAVSENDETFSVNIYARSGSGLGRLLAGHEVIIIDDDGRPASITVSNPRVMEMNHMVFEVTLKTPRASAVVVNYQTSDGPQGQVLPAAEARPEFQRIAHNCPPATPATGPWGYHEDEWCGDYTPSRGSLVFAPGETAKKVSVWLQEDYAGHVPYSTPNYQYFGEGFNVDEVFHLNVISPEGVPVSGVGTILDDPRRHVYFNVGKRNTGGTFHIWGHPRWGKEPDLVLDANNNIVDAFASDVQSWVWEGDPGDVHRIPFPRQMSFAFGTPTGDPEWSAVLRTTSDPPPIPPVTRLAGTLRPAVPTPRGQVYVYNGFLRGLPGGPVKHTKMCPSSSGLTGDTNCAAEVENNHLITPLCNAAGGGDYLADFPPTRITVSERAFRVDGKDNNQSRALHGIIVCPDNEAEPIETVTVMLTDLSDNVRFWHGSTTYVTAGYMMDNDADSVGVDEPTVLEGDTGDMNELVFRVTLRDHQRDVPTEVSYRVVDGTATTVDSDYTASTGYFSFQGVGIEYRFITVAVTGDEKTEPNETVGVELFDPVGVDIDGVGPNVPDPRRTFFGTIVNDDTPTVALDGPPDKVPEGDDDTDAGELLFTAYLTDEPEGAYSVTVDYATMDGAATTGDNDYRMAMGALTFSPGNTTLTVTVSIVGDTRQEPDESVNLTLMNAKLFNPTESAFSFLGGAATITADGIICDDDFGGEGTCITEQPQTLAVTIAGGEVTEGPGAEILFPVTLSEAPLRSLTLEYATADSSPVSATATDDYEVTAGALNFAIGETAKTVTVAVHDDAIDEPTETFEVALSNLPSNVTAAVGDDSATGTILDNDEPPLLGFGASTASATEGTDDNLVFTLRLDRAAPVEIAVDFATADAATGHVAVAGMDYTATTGILTFPVMARTATVSVSIIDDKLLEVDEGMQLLLSNPSAAVFSGGATMVTAFGNIISDDEATLGITATKNTAEEAVVAAQGSDHLEFTVTLGPGELGIDVILSYSYSALAPGIANPGSDYTVPPGTVTFVAGASVQRISVFALDDDLIEADEDLTLTLSGTNIGRFAFMPASATGKIVSDDFPSVRVERSERMESSNLEFNVTLNVDSAEPVTVDYSTSDVQVGSMLFPAGAQVTPATEGADYMAASGSLTFAPMERSMVVTVTVMDDDLFEADTESFALFLSDAKGIEFSTGGQHAIGSILDNEMPVFGVNATTASANEATLNESLVFAVTLDMGVRLGTAVTVAYLHTDGTATSGLDYTEPGTSPLVFAAGESAKTVTVPVLADTVVEPAETVVLELIAPQSPRVTYNPTRATATINDGGGAEFGIIATRDREHELPPNPADPADQRLEYRVSLAAGQSLATAVTLSYTYTGTATAGADYTTPSGMVTFMAGQTARDIRVDVLADDIDELDETVILTLVNPPPSTTFSPAAATGTIINVDFPLVDIRADTEGGSNQEGDTGDSRKLVFVADVTPVPTTLTVTADYATADGTATLADTDYTMVTGRVTFMPGSPQMVNLTVDIVGDEDIEPDETVLMALSNLDNGLFAGGATTRMATATIINDDEPEVSIAAIRTPILEGEDALFRISSDEPAPRILTVPLTVAQTPAGTIDGTAPTMVTLAQGGTATTLTVATVNTATTPTPITMAGTITATLTAVTDPLVSGYELGTDTARVIVDRRPGITIRPPPRPPDPRPPPPGGFTGIFGGTALEGTDMTLDFVVDMSFAATSSVTADYATADVTGVALATAGMDYTATTGILTFPVGETTKTVEVPILDDMLLEDEEYFQLQLSNISANAVLVAGMINAYGTIIDNDVATFGITTVKTPAKEEAASPGNELEFLVSLSGGELGTAVTVSYSHTAGTPTATPTDDYVVPPGTLTFPVGTSAQRITVQAVDDNEIEPDETVILTLVNPPTTLSVTYMPTAATGTIESEDVPTFSVSSATAPEDMNLVFTVTLNGALADATVAYSTGGLLNPTATRHPATSGDDYTAISTATLTFATGETSKEVTVTVVDDTLFEPDEERLRLILANPTGATLPNPPSGLGIIQDNEMPEFGIIATTAIANESPPMNFLVYEVTLDNMPLVELATAVTVAYNLSGTATEGADYRAPSPNPLIFAAMETAKTLTVHVIDDAEITEPAMETVIITLANPQSTRITYNPLSATGTINDDDDPPPGVTIEAVKPEVTEGDPAEFRVTSMAMGTNTTGTLTVSLALEETGDTRDPAQTQWWPNTTVTLEANNGTATLTVHTRDDEIDEPDSIYTARIAGDPNYTVGTPDTANVTVKDDDGPPTLTVNPAMVTEGATLNFEASLSRMSRHTVMASYATRDGTAVAGHDYSNATGTLVFRPGMVMISVPVSTMDDNFVEEEEDMRLVLSNPTEVTIEAANSDAAGLIGDNDDPELIIAAVFERIQEGEDALFAITAHDDPLRDLSIAVNVTQVGDYIRAVRPVFLPRGQTTTTLTVETGADELAGACGSITATLAQGGGYTIGAPDSAITYVRDQGRDVCAEDEVNKAILPYVALIVADETTRLVEDRVASAYEKKQRQGLWVNGASVGGHLVGQLQQRGASGGARSWGEVQPYELSFIYEGEGEGENNDSPFSRPTLWGEGYRHHLSVREGPVFFDGEVTGGLVAVDVMRPSGFLMGLALSDATAKMDFESASISENGIRHADGDYAGLHKTDLRGLRPYISWRLNSGGHMWSALGYDEGELEITWEDDYAETYRSEVELKLFGFGGFNPMFGYGDAVRLSFLGDGLIARLSETKTDGTALSVEVARVRMGVELDYGRIFNEYNVFSSKWSLAVREDFGDVKSGSGLELGGEMDLRFSAGLKLNLKSRALLGHNQSVREWGVSGGAEWRPRGDEDRGFSMSFIPHWGHTASRSRQLLEADILSADFNRARQAPPASYQLALGYGLSFTGIDLLQLYAKGMTVADGERVALGVDYRRDRNNRWHLYAQGAVNSDFGGMTIGLDYWRGEHIRAGYEAALSGGGGYSIAGLGGGGFGSGFSNAFSGGYAGGAYGAGGGAGGYGVGGIGAAYTGTYASGAGGGAASLYPAQERLLNTTHPGAISHDLFRLSIDEQDLHINRGYTAPPPILPPLNPTRNQQEETDHRLYIQYEKRFR